MNTIVPAKTSRFASKYLFSAEVCDALFAAVLVDDKIDAEAEMPGAIHLDYSQEQLTRGFLICRQVLETGVDRALFIRIIGDLYRDRTLDADDQLAFKHIRAKFKHLRFAFSNYDDRHRYPRVLHWITSIMGHLQDAFKNGQKPAVGRFAMILRTFLSPLPYAFVRRDIGDFRPSTPDGFRSYVASEMQRVEHALAKGEVSGKEFHEIRKVISRQGSLYDNLRILYPSSYHHRISRYLSTINGMMGRMHDDLIEQRINGTRDYHTDTFRFPDEIQRRLSTVVARYSNLQPIVVAEAS